MRGERLAGIPRSLKIFRKFLSDKNMGTERLNGIPHSLIKPDYIDFIEVNTGNLRRHNQSDFEIVVPSVGSVIYAPDEYSDTFGYKYVVESVEWGSEYKVVTVRVRLEE